MRNAAIAGDWKKYNQSDNFGELLPELQNKSHINPYKMLSWNDPAIRDINLIFTL